MNEVENFRNPKQTEFLNTSGPRGFALEMKISKARPTI